MFLLLPSKLQSFDLSGIVEILLQTSGYPRSFYAAPSMLVVRPTMCFSCLGLAIVEKDEFCNRKGL